MTRGVTEPDEPKWMRDGPEFMRERPDEHYLPMVLALADDDIAVEIAKVKIIRGKYKGKTFAEACMDQNYIEFLRKNALHSQFKELVEYHDFVLRREKKEA